MYQATTAVKKLAKLKKRYRFAAGGTSASKTISILQLLIDDAQSDTNPTLTSIVSESFPHLRKGAMRDFLDIMQAHGYYSEARWSKTEYTYTFESGSKIEFFSADQAGKVRGPRRDRLFVNEVNNVNPESFEQLAIRTREYIIGDWNPVSDFYIYEDFEIEDDPISVGHPDADFIILTHKDNEALEDQIRREIVQRSERSKQWERVYGKGLRGEVEGRVYKNWRIIDEIPHEAKLQRRWLDFGYSNDPTAIGDIYYYNGGYILDEQQYRKGMDNDAIGAFLTSLESPGTIVIADSAEPKSIDEIRKHGVTVLPARKKGDKGSFASYRHYTIDKVQRQKISVTKRSTNIIKEYRGYLWQQDKDGKFINTPQEFDDHHMDGIRYAINSMVEVETKQSEPRRKRHYDPVTGRLLS